MPTAECGYRDQPEKLFVDGPIVAVSIGSPSNHSTPRQYVALVDTGARLSAIDVQVAFDLNLPLTGVKEFGAAGGRDLTVQYMANVGVPALDVIKRGRFSGVRLSEAGYDFGVLLGRDFLEQFAMIYEGRNGFALISNDLPEFPNDFSRWVRVNTTD